jgi:hypothetical protein
MTATMHGFSSVADFCAGAEAHAMSSSISAFGREEVPKYIRAHLEVSPTCHATVRFIVGPESKP